MWLYYAFSSAVVLFLDVIYNPLHSEAMLNLALISDLENLCAPLSSFSPGAKRVMDVSREMNKVAFDIIKVRAKRKAQDSVNTTTAHGRLKKLRTEGSMQDGYGPGPSIETAGSPSSSESNQAGVDEHAFIPFPANFSWDDWDQWLNNSAL